MPHAIADSDDEGDEIEVFVSANEKTEGADAAVNPGSRDVNEESAVDGLDGAVERSASSTELLKRRMLSAERHLGTNSTSTGRAAASSPTGQVQKRRHTAAFASQPGTTAEKALKRTKTSTAHDNDSEAPGPWTSQSARFSEHSGHNSSNDLPATSLGQEFLNHEPAMFRDSGSTVADDSSAQEAMLRQALSSKKGLSTSVVKQAEDEEQRSSSFPWSASEQTRSAKSARNANPDDVDREDDGGGENIIEEDGSGDAAGKDGSVETPSKTRTESGAEGDDEGIVVHSASKFHASPTVEIEVQRPTSTRRDSTSTQKSTKGRKRKAEEDDTTDPLNSDDKAIGLPKERYQPRPSRRRATAIVEEAIDYSVRPEKAAKTKRTKSTTADRSSADQEPRMSQDELANLKADVDKTSKSSATPRKQSTQSKTKAATEKDDVVATKEQVSEENATTSKESSSQQAATAPRSSNQKSEDHIFVKPPRPTPKPQSTSKYRRSHTTIFEDHVEFLGSQKSPSLRQQQAARKSGLKDLQNEDGGSSQRKQKSNIVEDEDDEKDELAQDPGKDDEDEEDEDEAPKKRGRGRPSQASKTGAKPSKSREKILDDSDSHEEDAGKFTEKKQGEEPKKRGRGRPPKAAVAAKPDIPEKDLSDEQQPDAEPDKNAEATAEPDKGTEDGVSKAAESKVSSKENVTPSPSPDKAKDQNQATTKTPQKDAKQSTTLHSPIKSSSSVPLRVGLSKGRRIPSLLKIVNPQKPL